MLQGVAPTSSRPTSSRPTSTRPTSSRLSAAWLSSTILLLLLPVPAGSAELVAPYVNTVREDVELMLDLAELEQDDYLIDLGSGDGRIVIAAARRGARGHGIELRADLVALATEKAADAGVADRARFQEGDIFTANLSQATVVTAYLFPEANIQLRPKLLAELRPGTRVVSNAFHMGDWQPDRHEYGRTSGGAMLWVIPARIHGRWALTFAGRQLSMEIEQHYQEITVSLSEDGARSDTASAVLSGNEIAFSTTGDQALQFTGSIDGDSMAGQVVTPTGNQRWQANRL